ncbi:MAG: hypothetical protein M1358_15095 [Chloroflexi bacterium]|nr:hypothetical protein [Chloroflexota bacterium]
MAFRRLLILVEGSDDARFFGRIVKPRFEESYDWIEVREYAGKGADWVTNLIRSIVAMGADYIVVADIDTASCVSTKKEEVVSHYPNLDSRSIAVVVKEIESWYLAGLDHSNCRKLKIRYPHSTDSITKEMFNSLIAQNFDSKIDFMMEALQCFSVDVAKGQNQSFRYFAEKYAILDLLP